MIGRPWQRLGWALAVLGLLLAIAGLFRFPWTETLAALQHANRWLLLVAALVNLFSPFFKGCGWYVLLRRVAPCRWWVAQEANLIGSAVNSLSVGVTGEAARVAVIVERDRVPAPAAIRSIALTRVAEGLALACFVVLVPLGLEVPPQLRMAQLVGAVALVVAAIGLSGRSSRLRATTAFALASWMTEWVVYWMVLEATLGEMSYSAAFTALIATNLSGLLRLTPANVGVLQAAMVAALLPFGVPVVRAVAAGLALQAVQVLPVLAVTAVVVQRAGLAWAFTPKAKAGAVLS